MHIKSIIIRESKLDVPRQLQECIIISLPKALQLDYSVYLCTLKSCFQTHCLQYCPSKTAVFPRVIESQLTTYHRTAGCRQLTYLGSFLELTAVEVGLTSIRLFCTFEHKYLHHAFFQEEQFSLDYYYFPIFVKRTLATNYIYISPKGYKKGK